MILVIDTATRRPVVAVAMPDGALRAQRQWQSHHRHGEELLQRIDELLGGADVSRGDISAVVVGTGPGSFTGLRIGLATAKTIAYSLNVPIVGVSSTLALAAAATRDGEVTITLPAGASDRYVHKVRVSEGMPKEAAAPKLVAGMEVGATEIAIDIDKAPDSAIRAGDAAVEGLASALAALGARRLTADQADDVAALVPAYVALPRGLARAAAEMAWSPDLR